MILHTTINTKDGDILLEFCADNGISVSALLKTLVADFLDTTDKKQVEHIVSEAKKIKQGRPREY